MITKLYGKMPRSKVTEMVSKAKMKYMTLPSLYKYIHQSLNIFFLLEESETGPPFDFGQFLSEFVNKAYQTAINAYIVPIYLIFLLNNNFTLQMYSRHFYPKKKKMEK
jgi:predicted PurR-regulated permease PerM